jgi:hypothetical protein
VGNVYAGRGTNGMAVAGFVLGLLGFWPLGLVFSSLGLRQNRAGQSGRGLAVAGLVLSLLWGALTIGIVAAGSGVSPSYP